MSPSGTGRDRSDSEIEITPEMERAGMAALYGFDPDIHMGLLDEYAVKVYRAMELERIGLGAPLESSSGRQG